MAAKGKAALKKGDVIVMVGTVKGAFLLRASRGRRSWQRLGPFFRGEAVYAMVFDQRGGRQRLYAGPESGHWGATLRYSDNLGKTWTRPEAGAIRFPEQTGAALKRIWQIAPGRSGEPNVLYCGVEPAALFESHDTGATWSLVDGLWNHPHRPRWQPGGGGMCLHTVIADPTQARRLFVAVSTAGVYRSDDAGRTWRTAHKGVRAQFLPDKYPEFGQCVHKIAAHHARPGRLYLQNHWGLYRTDDAGESWTDVANGVPSDFGFALAAHPHDPDTAFIVPIESDQFRCTPGGKLRVYRTRNAGKSWSPLTRGLPQQDALETILRDALSTDSHDPAGVYFGTRSGKVYGSADNGNRWRLLTDGLPGVVCVKAAVVESAA
jgi:Sortilin, neurotensin receptor 3,